MIGLVLFFRKPGVTIHYKSRTSSATLVKSSASFADPSLWDCLVTIYSLDSDAPSLYYIYAIMHVYPVKVVGEVCQ
jgi:hypothetical protein